MLRKYEGMFLFNPAVTSDWESVQKELGRLMGRISARVIASTKWDERRLAFEIDGCRRGIYALTYFEADAPRIIDLERDVRLSESTLRCLVLRADHMTEEEMAEAVERASSRPASDEGRGEGHTAGDERETHDADSIVADDDAGDDDGLDEEESDDDPALEAAEAIDAIDDDEPKE